MNRNSEVERYNPTPEEGLDEEIVSKRKSAKLVNKIKKTVGKPFWRILVDVLNLFNVLLLVVAILLIVIKQYAGFLLLGISVLTILLSLFEEYSARRMMRKYKEENTPKALVVRSSFKYETPVDQLVLDDVVEINEGMEVYADSVVIRGAALVDESLLTGESSFVSKIEGDTIFAGSVIKNGSVFARVDKVGQENYSSTIQKEAMRINKHNTIIFKSVNILTLVVCIISIVLGLGMLAIHGFQKSFFSPILNMVGSIIPWGLFLVVFIAFISATIQLKKNNVRVMDFHSVEMLSKVDLLCVDKTGTLTDNQMKVVKVIAYGSNSEATITGILNDFVNLVGDDNSTANALIKYFNHPVNSKIINKLNFNSESKYSAVTFSSGSTFVLGAVENLNISNKTGVLHREEEFASNGYRVLVLAKAYNGIKNNKVDGECEVLGMVVLQEHIRDNVAATFKAFKENGTEVRVVSGDDPRTASEIARQAGIENYDKYVSLKGLSDEEVKEFADQYVVFGRATPRQKEILITTFKEQGHKVEMIGNGINDLLAMKQADFSVAMNDGAESAKNVSQMVLLDSNFDNLVVASNEGKKVYNNLQIITALFLTKMVFAMVLAIAFLFANMINHDSDLLYPFIINHYFVWELVLVGFASLFLLLEPNKKDMEGSFLGNAFKKAIGGTLTALLGVSAIFGLYHLQKHNVIYTGVYSIDSAVSMSVLLFTIVSAFVLMKAFMPFNKTRAISFALVIVIALTCVGAGALLSLDTATGEEALFGIDYKVLTPVNLVEAAITTTIVVTIYLVIAYIIEVFKGEHLEDENKKIVKKTTIEASIEITTEIKEGEDQDVNY